MSRAKAAGQGKWAVHSPGGMLLKAVLFKSAKLPPQGAPGAPDNKTALEPSPGTTRAPEQQHSGEQGDAARVRFHIGGAGLHAGHRPVASAQGGAQRLQILAQLAALRGDSFEQAATLQGKIGRGGVAQGHASAAPDRSKTGQRP